MEPTLSLNTCNNMAPAIPTAGRTSQLYKPLAAILKDSETGSALSMLEYFIQYMEEEDALHLLQFWFAVESFKTAAPSPKLTTTDYSRQSTTSTSTTQGRADKQCDVASVETSASGHMTQRQTVTEKGSNPECKARDSVLNASNDTQMVTAAVTNTVNEGTGQCINNNIEGRKNMCSTNSDTLQGQRELERPATISCDVTAPQSPTEGIHVHQRVLKQLSLSEEACIWCL